MCSYETQAIDVVGSGKGRQGWFSLSTATAYYDHPVHAFADHTLNIDFAAPEQGPSARVAVELTAESAVRLVTALADALVDVPASLSGLSDADLDRLRAVTSASTLPSA